MSMAESIILYLRIGEGKNLPRKDLSGKSDPYCIVKVDNHTVARTATIWRDLEPFWGEEYTLFVPPTFKGFSVFVYDEDTFGVDDVIGRVTFDREMLMQDPKEKEKWFPLIPAYQMHNYSDIQGEIKIQTTLYEQGDVKKIKARILEVRNLPDDACSNVEPSVTLSVLGENGSCQTVLTLREILLKLPEGNKKFWVPNEQKYLEFHLKETTCEYKMTALVKIESETHRFSGQASFILPEIKNGQIKDIWYKLQPLPPTTKQKPESLGSIRMKVRLTQERILPQQYYQSLVEILMNSVSDPESQSPTALSLIEKLTPADQMTLACQLVRLFIGQGLVIQFLDYMILQEIRKSDNPPTLFRGNSLAAKCMEQFMKIVGMPYLSDTLKPVLDRIFEEHKYCELDPSKVAVRRKSSTLRRLSLRSVDDEQDRSLSVLTAYLEAIMTSILSSVKACPRYMRIAFRNIARRVSDHFGDKPEFEDAKYTAVSGFLFLRFFAPAILGPKLFGLQDNHTDKNVSRTLTILAKTVQKIGNLEFPRRGGKEEWMESLHTWIAFYTDEVKDFLDKLVEVDDEEVTGCDDKRTVFSHSAVIKEGFIKKCLRRDTRLSSSFNFKKRYCWLTTESFLYAESNDSQTRQFLPTKKILAIERVDEAAFQNPNVFQVVSKDGGDDAFQILYLAAQDVNEMNQWLSAIRKITISNAISLNEFHPGVFRKTKWTCCKRLLRQAEGCRPTHAHVTLSDWRDPLDSDFEAQMIFTQLFQSREELRQRFQQTAQFEKDPKDHSDNYLDTKPRRKITTTPDLTVEFDNERTVAERLLEVINELEKAHQTFEEKVT
ncbi:rasGAP-activating-like protein 1 isoform X1 [Montipora foliosa]|uniref:rasGAP-activating-like protein 1 isoform X1 n=1 Tax=Montipora foliosa TaxID=591990 RepID=UPI0035F1708D